MVKRLLAVLSVAAFAGGAQATVASDHRAAALPSSIVVLGHSGATGAGSDPANPFRDVRANSWATGTNPKVKSVYLRILAKNPSIRGHNVNLAEDGATVDAFLGQAQKAVSLKPKPALVLIQIHDNDIRCDGTDKANYPAFRATFVSALKILADDLPKAQIFVVSSAGSIASYAKVLASLDEQARAKFYGDSPCDFYNRSGRERPKNTAYLQRVVDGYEAQLAAGCARFPQCRYDRGALSRIVVTRRDLATDLQHNSVFGHTRIAAAAWSALRLR